MTQKLRYFCTLLLMAVVGVAWAQSDYSDDYTGNVTLSTTATMVLSWVRVKMQVLSKFQFLLEQSICTCMLPHGTMIMLP